MSWWMFCAGGWAVFMVFFLFAWWPKIVGPRNDDE